MRKVIFVTGNAGKFREAKDILAKKGIEVLQQTGGYPEIQEDELEPIAAYGAKWASEELKMPVMVDDSGLFIQILNGFPGPYSAFVEEHLGNKKVLKLMEGETDR
ncbi:MAG: non-canonical purine NTP pyrophosphatase, partial [Methanosarcinaceae archaeon]|nr:non-canonical purine NTP pyrophosphatase [Methanosarcinaceae archaeon]